MVVFFEHGFGVNFGTGKTEAVLDLNGPRSQATHRALVLAGLDSVKINGVTEPRPPGHTYPTTNVLPPTIHD